jgi:hypothetical protein
MAEGKQVSKGNIFYHIDKQLCILKIAWHFSKWIRYGSVANIFFANGFFVALSCAASPEAEIFSRNFG